MAGAKKSAGGLTEITERQQQLARQFWQQKQQHGSQHLAAVVALKAAWEAAVASAVSAAEAPVENLVFQCLYVHESFLHGTSRICSWSGV